MKTKAGEQAKGEAQLLQLSHQLTKHEAEWCQGWTHTVGIQSLNRIQRDKKKKEKRAETQYQRNWHCMETRVDVTWSTHDSGVNGIQWSFMALLSLPHHFQIWLRSLWLLQENQRAWTQTMALSWDLSGVHKGEARLEKCLSSFHPNSDFASSVAALCHCCRAFTTLT